ncbi:MAG TPA: hypothetical protein DHM90_15025, partial [Clostridiaceae bacterium]|nr:hypothetical protein [Clostridiaceae bacterium]
MKKEVLRSIAKKIVLLVILIGLNFNVFVLADIISVSLTVAEGGYIGTSYSLVAQGESYESPNYKYW